MPLWHKDGGPQDPLSRYAFGWSDEKPGVTYWIILGLMAAYVASQIFSFS